MVQLTIQSDERPVRSADVTWRTIGDELLLVHTLLKQYHVLNHVAAQIWQLADASNTVAEIVDSISQHYDEKQERVEQDVLETLSGLRELQLLSFAGDDDATPSVPGAD
ncbi:MAG: PqqD family protein [Proteobacteria bacterium]|nr:PqqD family protein [Pseudomonadota bacterium]